MELDPDNLVFPIGKPNLKLDKWPGPKHYGEMLQERLQQHSSDDQAQTEEPNLEWAVVIEPLSEDTVFATDTPISVMYWAAVARVSAHQAKTNSCPDAMYQELISLAIQEKVESDSKEPQIVVQLNMRNYIGKWSLNFDLTRLSKTKGDWYKFKDELHRYKETWDKLCVEKCGATILRGLDSSITYSIDEELLMKLKRSDHKKFFKFLHLMNFMTKKEREDYFKMFTKDWKKEDSSYQSRWRQAFKRSRIAKWWTNINNWYWFLRFHLGIYHFNYDDDDDDDTNIF